MPRCAAQRGVRDRCVALVVAVLLLACRASAARAQTTTCRAASAASPTSPASSTCRPRTARPNGQPIGLNYPVTSGDNLWVGGDGRAEVDYGGGQFRLAGDTNLHVSRLDDRQIALFVAQGRVIVRVRVLDPGDVGAHRHAEHADRS